MTATPPDTAVPELEREPSQPHPPQRRGRWRRRDRDHSQAHPLPSALLTRLGHAALWLLVLGSAGAGTAALVLHITTSTAPEPTAAPPAPTTPAEGFAELYVAAYLGRAGHGTEEAIAAFYPTTVTLADVTPGAVWVSAITAVAVDERRPGYWAVTVAADVLTAGEDGWEPDGSRYYTVGVAETGDALAATGLPSQIAAPPPAAEAPEPAVATLGTPDDEPAVEAAAQFLAAYLTGDGELDRYTAPDIDLDPVEPAPFAEVELTRVGAEPGTTGATLLRAEVTATAANGLTQVLEYSMDVIERDGRFEIAALHPAPPLPQPPAS